MRTLRLRYIDYVRFGRTEETNYRDLVRRVPQALKLGPDDVVLFIAASEDQMIFIHGFGEITDGKSTHTYLRSERLRLVNFAGPKVSGTRTRSARNPRARWDPLMLVDYGRAVGIEFEGLKSWEEHKAEMLQRLRDSYEKQDQKTKKRSN